MPAKLPSLDTELLREGKGKKNTVCSLSITPLVHPKHVFCRQTILSLHLSFISVFSSLSQQQRARTHRYGILDTAQGCKIEEKKAAPGSNQGLLPWNPRFNGGVHLRGGGGRFCPSQHPNPALQRLEEIDPDGPSQCIFPPSLCIMVEMGKWTIILLQQEKKWHKVKPKKEENIGEVVRVNRRDEEAA